MVNEAIDDGPEGAMRKSKWREAIGDDYIAKAFEYAHQADPQAELYYNDYNLTVAPKRAAALRIVKALKQWGLRVDGVGEQGHWLLGGPSLADIEATITIAAAGFKALITELDVDVLQEQAMEVARADSHPGRQRFHGHLVQDAILDETERAPDHGGRSEPGRGPRRRLRAAAETGAKAGFGGGRGAHVVAHVRLLGARDRADRTAVHPRRRHRDEELPVETRVAALARPIERPATKAEDVVHDQESRADHRM